MKRTYTPEQLERKRIYDIEYRKNNPDKIKERGEKYRKNNKDKIKELNKKYTIENKEVKRLYDIEYRKSIIDKKKAGDKKYYEENKQRIKETSKKYRTLNRVKMNARILERKANNPLFKLKCSMRSLIKASFTYKGFVKPTKTELILGCSLSDFKAYIEAKFEPWMNWDNKGNWNGIPTELNVAWDVDHIIPLRTAKTIEDIIKLCHYTNLQPLCSYTNRNIKNGKL